MLPGEAEGEELLPSPVHDITINTKPANSTAILMTCRHADLYESSVRGSEIASTTFNAFYEP